MIDFNSYNKLENETYLTIMRYRANKLLLAFQQAGLTDCKVISYEDKLAPEIKAKFKEGSDRRNALFISHFSLDDAEEIVNLAGCDEDVHKTMEEKQRWARENYNKHCAPGEEIWPDEE